MGMRLYPLPGGRVVKMVGTRKSIQSTMSLSRVGLKFFYKFQYGLIFDSAHLEPGSPELNP